MLAFAHAGKRRRGETYMPFKCNQPAVPTVQQDDATVRITRWDFAPGAATGWHRHPHDYVVVPVVDGELELVGPDGGRSRAQLHKGQSYFRKAGVEHDVINAGAEIMTFVEVELKDTGG